MSTEQTAIDVRKVEAFTNAVIGDVGAAMAAALVSIGDELGLYRTMADSRPVTPADLAARTGTAERYVREWLNVQAAGGWVDYDPATRAYTLPPEHAACVTDEQSPMFLLGAFDFAATAWPDRDAVLHAFRTGEGIGWHQHDARLYTGT